MSDRTREVPKLSDLTYAHTLVIESTHKYKVHGPYGSDLPWQVGAIWPMDLVFIRESLYIEFRHLSGSI